MRVGNLLEVLAALCLVAASYLWLGAPLALLAAALCLVYFAQCYAATPFRLHRRPKAEPVEVHE